jgi:16S rRNA C967 or C1407 C5-methylase (RsmB/RsmF family)
MKNLPADFVQLMIQHHGDAVTESLCSALLDTEPEVSVRLNTRKIEAHESLREMVQDILPSIGEAVSWCPDAYYLTERPAFTFDPLFHAGVYYVQEASSMYVAHLLSQYGPTVPSAALDLCAAPGGKSTLLAGLLPEGSLLLSNEPMPKRANILAENMQKWTRMSAGEYPVASLVANNYPADFGAFTDCFDVLVTDVPCSGEGMFRKDEQAIADWSLDNVMMCVERQRSILQDIWHTLKSGGLLIYSTCTFNRYEDEDNVRWICSSLGAQLLEERHFFPGRDRGEGFYCAALRKVDATDAGAVAAETKDADDFPARKEIIIRKAQRTLRVLPKAFECEGPLVNLSYDDALAYLRRETIRVDAPKGQLTLAYNGIPLGPGKGVGNRINNQYPEPWRIRTTYTKKWSLLGTSLNETL